MKDPYSQKEMDLLYRSLQKDILNPKNFQQSNFAVTHGNGIDYANDQLLEFISSGNVSLIWSPVSNLLLYQDTHDIRKLLDRNINICLGSDWSPSGSKHVLDELKFAEFANALLDLKLSRIELFKMVTLNPARVLGTTQNGRIREGANADLFVCRKKNRNDNALDALFEGSDKDISFVMVNGRIVFGLKSFFKENLQVDFQEFPPQEGAGVAERGVSINSALNFKLADSLGIIDTLMQRYCSIVIAKPGLQRTRFLSADDDVYNNNIGSLKGTLLKLYTH